MKKSAVKKFCEFEKKGGVFPLLPTYFKMVGIGIAVLAIVAMLITYYQATDHRLFFKDLFMHLILLGLFLISISREKNEDERVKGLRYRAFAFAFVLGTGILMLLPFINLLLSGLFDNVLEWEFQSFFFIMSSYLFYYLMYFKTFQRQL